MSAPVIDSVLTLDVVVGLKTFYRIHGTQHPTSFDATPLPPGNFTINTDTGKMSGKISTADVYDVTISATNADGTGTATLVITATDSVPIEDSTGISVIQGKYWSEAMADELIDYADIDAAAQPVAEIDSETIGTTQLSADALANKIDAIGGAGWMGELVMANDTSFPTSTIRNWALLGSVTMPGISAYDVVIVNEEREPDGSWPTARDFTYYGVASRNLVKIYVGSTAPYLAGTIYAGSVIKFRVFSFPT